MGAVRVHGSASRREAGFTLLELMISMTLLVVMMTMTYSVFQTAMTTVPRGEEAADRAARLRMTTAMLTRQVRSLVDYPGESEETDCHSYFVGNEQSLSFVTAAPQLGGGEGLSVVTWATDGANLGLSERADFSTASLVAGLEEGAVPASEKGPELAQAILLSGLRGARFQYLRLEGDESEWLDVWDGVEEQGPPAAIRVTLDGLGIGDSYWVQEIPVLTVVYALGNFDSDVCLGSDEESFGPTDDDSLDEE